MNGPLIQPFVLVYSLCPKLKGVGLFISVTK
jgi:hypothetical protein